MSLPLSPRESMLTVNVGGKPIKFLMGTGLDILVITQPVSLPLGEKIQVQGATGQSSRNKSLLEPKSEPQIETIRNRISKMFTQVKR